MVGDGREAAVHVRVQQRHELGERHKRRQRVLVHHGLVCRGQVQNEVVLLQKHALVPANKQNKKKTAREKKEIQKRRRIDITMSKGMQKHKTRRRKECKNKHSVESDTRLALRQRKQRQPREPIPKVQIVCLWSRGA